MGKKTMKGAVLVALLGTLLQFGGCLGGNLGQLVLANIVADQVAGFVPDLTGLLGGGG